MPAASVPWKDVDALCNNPNHGVPWRMDPKISLKDAAAYTIHLRDFLRSLAYRSNKYAWLHDANWRLTGPYEGCPPQWCEQGPASDGAHLLFTRSH